MVNIRVLNDNPNTAGNIKLSSVYSQFQQLLKELDSKDLTPSIIASINNDVEALNVTPLTGNELKKLVNQKQSGIIKMVEKELKIVPKNYYRNMWLALGMSAFGLPIGVGIGLAIGNIGLLAIGLPIGMAIGIPVGAAMDKKAFTEGRQLDIEIK